MFNDLDVDFSADPKAADAYRNDQRNLRKIREHSKQLNLNIIYPLRTGKRLLVLDIDYSKNNSISSHIPSLSFVCDSNPGYQAVDHWGIATTGMRQAATARVSRGYIPLLRHLYLASGPFILSLLCQLY